MLEDRSNSCVETVEPLTVSALQDKAHAMAESKGFVWEPKDFPTMIALAHSELSEALEAWRGDEAAMWYGAAGKPEGYASELADLVIRVADTAAVMGVDLEDAIEQKMAYNATRSYRHGGKRI